MLPSWWSAVNNVCMLSADPNAIFMRINIFLVMLNLLQLIGNELLDFQEKCFPFPGTERHYSIILLFNRPMKRDNLYSGI